LIALTSANRLGLFPRVAASTWRQRRLLVLCYHGVSLSDEHEWSDVYISERRLEQRLETLKKVGASVLPLGEALERLRADDLPPSSVSITFDEGMHDFYSKAYPLLQAFQVPTTLYVPTYYSTYQRPIFDMASSYMLWRGRGRYIETGNLLPGAPRVRIPTNREKRTDLHLQMRAYANARGLSASEKDAMLRELSAKVGIDWDEFLASRMLRLMSIDELRSLDQRLVDVQLHTHRHRTPRDYTLFVREIEDNLAALEVMGFPKAGRVHFCYPSGDSDSVFYPWLESLGIQSATTCEPAYAERLTHPLNLPRFLDTMGTTRLEFRSWVSGVAGLLPRRTFHRRRDTWQMPEMAVTQTPRAVKPIDFARPRGAALSDREMPLTIVPQRERPIGRSPVSRRVFPLRELQHDENRGSAQGD
jgi:peptidoglycan/xylan/chitin deacetylase (PgdA/CDA1 family)